MLTFLTITLAASWSVFVASVFHTIGYHHGERDERRWGYRPAEEEQLIDRDEADWWKGRKDATNQKR